MAEQTGRSVAAIQATQSVLMTRHSTATDADSVLADAVAGAHAAAVEGIRRLDAIAEAIDNAVQRQAALAIDTPMGAREFQKFLIAKQREISAVISTARNFSDAKKTVLEGLRQRYTASPDEPTTG
jgi:hypothetical protein